MNRLTIGVAIFLLVKAAPPVAAQLLTYPDPTLHYVYPAGGKQGDTVAVELGGLNGLTGARDVLVEGPLGVTVRDVKPINAAEVRATFVIAPDAAPGCRLVRVLGAANGLTCFRYFYVGKLPCVVEKEPNNTPATAQEVTLPAVIDGRFNPKLDVDCFAFAAKAGQRITAAVLAHGMDSRVRSGTGGFLDSSLELLDDKGRVVAAAEDTIGLDPLLDVVIKTPGRHVLRLQCLGYGGAPSAVYRLTLGEIAYATHVFPPGGQRGKKVDVEFGGPNVPPGTRRALDVPADSKFPWHAVRFDQDQSDGRELAFIHGDHPETIEAEPNDDLKQAPELKLPLTINGRFDKPGDADCYRVRLQKGQGMVLEVTAQRHLRSPVDTLLEVFDASGKLLAENDDGALYAGQCEHDFASADSRLEFTAPADGDFVVRLREQTGAGGPTAIYRLTAEPLQPDFRLFQWPDAVPIWGPGTTASFVVQVQRWGGLKGDIDLRIEGLPPGWKGSAGNMPVTYYTPASGATPQKALMTITAPADAAPATLAPFRVIGRARQDDKVLEREAQPLTLYGSSHNDRMHLRFSQQARAVVAGFMDCVLETSVTELTAPVNGKVEIPVKVTRRPNVKEIGISVDGETPAAGCGFRVPLVLKPEQSEIMLPLEVGARQPGTYGIVVSRSWAADLRAGRPGPCTPLILLHIKPAEKK